MTNVNSIDTNASGTLITTEFGGPPQLFPANVPNYQAYQVSNVYPMLYSGTASPPFPYNMSPLAQQQYWWNKEVAYLQANDPLLVGVESTGDYE